MSEVKFSLSTERLLLKVVEAGDLSSIREAVLSQSDRFLRSNARTLEKLKDDPDSYLRDSQEQWRQGTMRRFALWLEGQFVGVVSLGEIDHRRKTAELSYVLLAEAEGRGYACEACLEIIRFARTSLHLESLWLRTLEGNERSRKLARTLGFVLGADNGEPYRDALGVVHRTELWNLDSL